jgi:DNA recombination protein RmuC
VDCKVELPNPPGPICIDAKFPLESYHLLRGADDDGARAAALRAFGQAVLIHVQDIAAKYIVPGETAEGALMFLPSEAIYAELHASCPDVVEKANRAKVYIVSPTTLWAVLHTLRAILKDVQMREQAGRIQQEVGLLLRDVELLDERVGGLAKHFDQTGKDIRQIQVSTEKIMKRAEAIGEVQLEDPVAATPPIAAVRREQASGE